MNLPKRLFPGDLLINLLIGRYLFSSIRPFSSLLLNNNAGKLNIDLFGRTVPVNSKRKQYMGLLEKTLRLHSAFYQKIKREIGISGYSNCIVEPGDRKPGTKKSTGVKLGYICELAY